MWLWSIAVARGRGRSVVHLGQRAGLGGRLEAASTPPLARVLPHSSPQRHWGHEDDHETSGCSGCVCVRVCVCVCVCVCAARVVVGGGVGHPCAQRFFQTPPCVLCAGFHVCRSSCCAPVATMWRLCFEHPLEQLCLQCRFFRRGCVSGSRPCHAVLPDDPPWERLLLVLFFLVLHLRFTHAPNPWAAPPLLPPPPSNSHALPCLCA
jgi:hypothetical protein